MYKWPIRRSKEGASTEFELVGGGGLEEFKDLLQFLERELGVTIGQRSVGIVGTTIELHAGNADLELLYDGGYQTIRFRPLDEAQVDSAQAFADLLREKLAQT